MMLKRYDKDVLAKIFHPFIFSRYFKNFQDYPAQTGDIVINVGSE